MYLHHLLSFQEDNLAKEILEQQIKKPRKNDWFSQVQGDLADLGLELNVNQIPTIAKSKFKTIVKGATIESYFASVNQAKDDLSKGRDLCYKELNIQPYLTPEYNLTTEDMKNILKIRLRDIPLKCNFPGAFSDRKCIAAPLCTGEDSNEHLFACEFMSDENEPCGQTSKYESIFRDKVQEQANISRIMFSRLERRNHFIKQQEMVPADPRKSSVTSLGIREARQRKRKNNKI